MGTHTQNALEGKRYTCTQRLSSVIKVEEACDRKLIWLFTERCFKGDCCRVFLSDICPCD